MTYFATEVRDLVNHLYVNEDFPFQMRYGIHTGPVVAGVIGIRKFQFDVWGDTVNTASRMESSGINGEVHVSEVHAHALHGAFVLMERGTIVVKGKGEMNTYVVICPTDDGNTIMSVAE